MEHFYSLRWWTEVVFEACLPPRRDRAAIYHKGYVRQHFVEYNPHIAYVTLNRSFRSREPQIMNRSLWFIHVRLVSAKATAIPKSETLAFPSGAFGFGTGHGG